MKSLEKPQLGRPRSDDAHQAILQAALQLVSAQGFRAITVNQIAAHAGVGKMTLYRRWPNKAAVVMDALLELVGPETAFPSSARALDSIREQLGLQAKFFRSRYGRLIRSLLAESQFDEELATAFRERWIQPRRGGVIQVLKTAIQEGDLRSDIDLETTTDMLYGPLYYRLLLGTGTINTVFIDHLYRQFLAGHQVPRTKRTDDIEP
ncbi:TetR/AcrR family transcriptional regulator [Granulicella sp. dw_53]|uniref:TetR/AcrR family transcriptional regulator n=1 Tax=Granulicella sp. dw_53 TaxID=2719792 RepID=UPI001BD1CD21